MKTKMNMKKFHIKTLIAGLLLTSLIMTSCNKDIDDPTDIPRPSRPSLPTIGSIITTDTTFSYLLAAVNRVGLADAVFTTTSNLTVFAPPNAAFRGLLTTFGLPPAIGSISLIPLTTLTPLIQYHVLGYQVPAASIPETFPNLLAHSMFALPGAPAPFVRMPSFPSRRAANAWLNNVPVVRADVTATNGVIHVIGGVAVPPSQTLSAIIAGDTSLSFLRAAILRADSGQVGMNRLDSVMNLAYGPNLTVFAPDNNAFRAYLTSLGLPASPAVFAGLPVQTVRAIVSYHGLGTRVFSPNLPATALAVPTLLTAAVPGTTLSVSTAGVKGLANPTTATITTANRHALNGIIHVVNQVLRFQ
jgi:uncharacterized surface protein with fasciclin (FAS1) repeats